MEDSFVPTGSKTIHVSSGQHGFTIGTRIVIQFTPNDDWLTDMSGMEEYGWTTDYYNQLTWRRIITNINGAELTLNAPLVQAIDQYYGGADVYGTTKKE